MSKALPAACVLLCALTILGCDPTPDPAKQPRLVPIVLSTSSRFQIVSSSAFGIALDTKTGQLCHTFNQSLDTFIPATGEFRNTGDAGHPSLDSIPLCIDLSQNEAATAKQIMDANQKDRARQEKMQQEIDQMQKQLDRK